ncbi:hypothetical protein SteCoe_34338 [Stentor coeruleus]|uniref:non-specific serine/threonine protein kinase n=1 Tax=Stentor coeruleus TaxID=5963 RepID=A0A1R2AUR1_9CILI|nr:hypothetical protein SteCoe_34338 [Stentor coeruleus]
MGCSPSKSTYSSNGGYSSNLSKKPISNLHSFKIEAGIFVGKRKGNINNYYTIEEKLGEGSFGFVRAATSILTGHKRAIKTINKNSIIDNPKNKSKFFAEVDILIKTDHPNIVKLYEFYEDDKYFHLVTEFVTGGELLDLIVKNKTLTESLAAYFFKQLISGVYYCHLNNIVHRDLKLQNMLLDRDSSDAILKIIDFGTSQIMMPKGYLSEAYGTLMYMAPEVFRGQYNEKCDIWSCGVILYILLSGRPPFTAKTDIEISMKISTSTVSFDQPEWANISDSAISLIKKMLTKDPNIRISAQDTLHHRWLIENSLEPYSPGTRKINHHSSLENMKNFKTEWKLQQAVLTYIGSQIAIKDGSRKYMETFKQLDRNGDGKLSKDELVSAYSKHLCTSLAVNEAEKVMKIVDVNNSGFIDYTEFVIAAEEMQEILNCKNLEEAFKAFDRDNSGKISVEEVKEILGCRIRSKDRLWKRILNEVDRNGDGELDFEEFKNMMMRLGSAKNEGSE